MSSLAGDLHIRLCCKMWGRWNGSGGSCRSRVQPLPGTTACARFVMKLLGRSAAANAVIRGAIVLLSELARDRPALTDYVLMRVLPWVGLANDIALWPCVALLASLVSAVRWCTGLCPDHRAPEL